MYCLTIEENDGDLLQLYFNNKKHAEDQKEKIILDEIRKYLYIEDIHIELQHIDINVLENLLTALVARKCKCNFFDVTLSKINIEDE